MVVVENGYDEESFFGVVVKVLVVGEFKGLWVLLYSGIVYLFECDFS